MITRVLVLICLVMLASCQPAPLIPVEEPGVIILELPEEDRGPFKFSPLSPQIVHIDEEPPLFCIPKDQSLILLKELKEAEGKIHRLQEGYR